MNCHIKENTAGHFDICGVRGLGITGSNLENMSVADSAVIISLTDCGEVVVETAVETNLELYFGVRRKSVRNCLDFSNGVVNGLFAENVLARVYCFD